MSGQSFRPQGETRMSDLATLGITVRPRGPVEQRVPCPRCGDGHGAHDDALGVNVDTGVYHCFRCGWKGCASTNTASSVSPPVRIDDPAIAERKRERLRTTWRETVPLYHPKARPHRQYLEVRGLVQTLSAPPGVLRAHPALPYYDTATQRELGKHPALVALFADSNGEGVTLHATYLRADGRGKAPVSVPKKILGVPVRGATKGGAIRLYKPEDGRLGVAEGIESALSLRLIRKIPVWSSYCADNLTRICLPRLRELEIGVDVDETGLGEAKARALAARVLREQPALRVLLVMPEGRGPRDLNDELRARAG